MPLIHRCVRTSILQQNNRNPLNAVRRSCNTIMHNDNRMSPDKTITFDPAKSVLQYRIGDELKLNDTAFKHLSSVLDGDIERRYL